MNYTDIQKKEFLGKIVFFSDSWPILGGFLENVASIGGLASPDLGRIRISC